MNASRVEMPARTGELMLGAFLATVTMLFAGFTAAYFIRRTGSDWHHVPLPSLVWVNTLLLIASSATVELASRRANPAWLRITLGLGLLFLVGQLLAWRQLSGAGHDLSANPHGSFFYVLSAVHGLHLLGGIGALIYVSIRAAHPRLVANYWHFVGVVWLYVLLLLLTL